MPITVIVPVVRDRRLKALGSVGIALTLFVLLRVPTSAEGSRRVVVYTQTGCGPCTTMKNDLLRAGVTPETYDITADPVRAQEFRALGGSGTPLTWVENGRDPSGNPIGATFSGRNQDAVRLAQTPLPDAPAPAAAGSVSAPQPHPAQQLLEQQVPPPRTQQQSAQERLSTALRQSSSFQEFLRNIAEKAARALADLTKALGTVPGAGQTSQYRTPDPRYRGYGRPGGYDLLQRRGDPKLLHKKEFSGEPNPQPQDVSRAGVACRGNPGDPWWHWTCACRCGEVCPTNLFISCENPACNPPPDGGHPIRHHDRFVQTRAECLRHSDAPHHPISF